MGASTSLVGFYAVVTGRACGWLGAGGGMRRVAFLRGGQISHITPEPLILRIRIRRGWWGHGLVFNLAKISPDILAWICAEMY